MQLATAMYLSRYASLPAQFAEPRYGLTGTLLGWGRNETNGSIQQLLQEVNVILFTGKECQQRLGITLHLSHICSGKPDETKGQCTVSSWAAAYRAAALLMSVCEFVVQGDSGGPLISDDYHVGIVSWSHKPCANWPGVFTKVSHYRDWIRTISGV